MGHSITIQCRSCDYSDSIKVGIGFWKLKYPELLEYVHPKEQPRVKSEIGFQEVHSVVHYRHFYQCMVCNHMFSSYQIMIQYGEAQQSCSPLVLCEKCDRPTHSLDIEKLSEYQCPCCGNKTLEEDDQAAVCLWD